MEWRPIHTAPKDGSTVFLKGERGGKVRSFWMTNQWGLTGWHTGPLTGFNADKLVMINSTHWMPVK